MAGMDDNKELIGIARSIRGIGDLLQNLPSDHSFLGDDTLDDIGMTLENLSTKALIILGWEEAPKSLTMAQGGAE